MYNLSQYAAPCPLEFILLYFCEAREDETKAIVVGFTGSREAGDVSEDQYIILRRLTRAQRQDDVPKYESGVTESPDTDQKSTPTHSSLDSEDVDSLVEDTASVSENGVLRLNDGESSAEVKTRGQESSSLQLFHQSHGLLTTHAQRMDLWISGSTPACG